jgi:hypothetical protein
MTQTDAARPDTSDMIGIHNAFRSSLSSATAFVESAGDDERRALIANYYENIMAFLQAHHDTEEAIVFPALSARAPECRALIEQLAGEHQEVVTLMGGVNESLAAWPGDPSAAPAVSRSLGALDAVLSSHFSKEEAEVLPAAADHLSLEEWGSQPGYGMAHFEGDKIWLILGLIREQMTAEQRDTMLREMPPPARDMWETMGETSFNGLIAEVRQAD